MTHPPELHSIESSPPVGVRAQADLLPAHDTVRSHDTAGPMRSLLGDRNRCFLVLMVAGVAAALLAEMPNLVLQDTWLALVDGRQVAQHGIPRHVVLTLFGHGHAWVDQQWLAQLWMYGLHRVGGLGLVAVVNVALIAAGLLGAAAASMRLGASARSVVLVLPLAAIAVAFTNEVRTQPYAYPLFVLTVYLLAADSRRPSRSVYWCLPVLALWGNLHGSASLGAGLVVLGGLSMLWSRRGALADPTAWRRPLALIVLAPAALLITPYGTEMVSYYRATLLSPAFRSFVTEWQPVTYDVPLAIVFFLLAGVVVWALGRHGAASTLWERIATLVLAAGAIIALRNVVWFALAALILLPLWIDAAVRARERPAPARPRLNATLLGAAAVAVIVLALSTVTAGTARLTPSYPARTLEAVRAALAVRPGAPVLADETYADWLLWELPRLSGRVAYDAAFELLSRDQLKEIADLKSVTGLNWSRVARGYPVLVLVDRGNPNPVHALRVQTGAQLRYRGGGVAVLVR